MACLFRSQFDENFWNQKRFVNANYDESNRGFESDKRSHQNTEEEKPVFLSLLDPDDSGNDLYNYPGNSTDLDSQSRIEGLESSFHNQVDSVLRGEVMGGENSQDLGFSAFSVPLVSDSDVVNNVQTPAVWGGLDLMESNEMGAVGIHISDITQSAHEAVTEMLWPVIEFSEVSGSPDPPVETVDLSEEPTAKVTKEASRQETVSVVRDGALRMVTESRSNPLKKVPEPDIKSLQSYKEVKEEGVLKKIGRYEVKRETRGGGQGRILFLHDPMLGRDVVMKVLKVGKSSNLKRFVREMKSMAKFSHSSPHIADIYIAGRIEHQDADDEVFYILPEYDAAANDEEFSKSIQALPGEKKQEFIREQFVPLLDALEEVHKKGMVHRDIKPANIFVDRRYSPQSVQGRDFLLALGDFGLVMEQGEVDSAIIGSPQYMAPEQIFKPEQVSEVADLFSLVLSIAELMTGHRFSQKVDTVGDLIQNRKRFIDDVMYRKKRLMLFTAQLVQSGVALEVARVMVKALEPNHKKRISVEKFKKELTDALDLVQNTSEGS